MSRSPEQFASPPESESEKFDGSVDDSAREATEQAGESRDFTAEIGRDVESARRGVAQAVWGEPARFAAAVSRDSAGEFNRFLEKFAAIDDRYLPTDELKRGREAARAAIGKH